MSLFNTSDIENILNGSIKAGLNSSRFINNAVQKSFRNKQMLRSAQQFNTEDLVEQLKSVANDALRLEKALGLLRKNDPKNKDIKAMRNLLDALNQEKDVLSRRLNEALASRDIADDVVRDISRNKTPMRRGSSTNIPNRRTTLGSNSLNLLGTAINIAGYVGNRRRSKSGGTSDLSPGTASSGNSDFVRQTLKISRDTYARDKEFQDEFKKDFDNTNDKIIRRLDKIIDKLDKVKRTGGGGSGGGSDFPDVDLPDGEKKDRRNRRGRRSRFGLRTGAAVGGAAALTNGAEVIDSNGNTRTLENNPVSDIFKFLTDPRVESAFQGIRSGARGILGLSNSNTNTNVTTPSAPAPTPAPVIPQGQNFGGMPGLPRLNTARPIRGPEITGSIVAGASGIAEVRTNDTAIDVKPQATVIINTRDLDIKTGNGGNSNNDSNCCCSDKVVNSNTVGNAVDGGGGVAFGGIGGGIGSGSVYPGGGAGTRAIFGSRGGGRGQAFTPRGMQRQTITTNPFTGQPVMTLPSDVAGAGTAGGGIANPYGFSGANAGSMGSVAGLPGSVTNQTITGSGAYPKFLGATSGGALGGLISSGEGGYGSYNKGMAGDSRDKIDFSQMTVADLMQRQSLPRGDPNRIFAFGKYQVIPETMRGAVQAMGIDPSAKVTPQLQEEIYRNYLISQKRPEVKDYITSQNEDAGKLYKAQKGLASEFASVANPDTGASMYGGIGGNRASISADKTSAALQEERRRYQENIKKGMKPEEAWSALSNPQGMDSSQSGATAGGAPTIPDARPGETPGQLASRIKSLNPNIGNGECVALAKQAVGLDATPGANSVSDWRKGESATARELPIGTPVATFMDRQGNDSDRYDGGQGTGISRSRNGGLGTTHAAVVAGYEKDGNGKITGMQVWEQWNGSGGPRLKTYPVDPSKPGADNAGNFYAIDDSKGNPLGGANNPRSQEALPNAMANSGPVYDPTKTFGDPSKFSSPAPTANNIEGVTPLSSSGNRAINASLDVLGGGDGFKGNPANTDLTPTIAPTDDRAFKPGETYNDYIKRRIQAGDDAATLSKNSDYALEQSKNPLPGESFADYFKRQTDADPYRRYGLGENEIDYSRKFGEGQFNVEDKNKDLQERFRKEQENSKDPNSFASRLDSQGIKPSQEQKEYYIHSGTNEAYKNEFYPKNKLSIAEIKALYGANNDTVSPSVNIDGSPNAATQSTRPGMGRLSSPQDLYEKQQDAAANAATNSSSSGSTRQSAAPPPPETPAPNPSEGGGSGGSSATNDNRQSNPIEDQKATGQSTAPSISEIPVSHQDLGLAVLNSYDL